MTDFLAGPLFWVAVVTCAGAQVALLHAFFFGAARPPAAAPGRFRATETLWTLLPAAALVVLLGASWRAMQLAGDRELGPSRAAPASEVRVSMAPAAGAVR